MSAIVNMSDAQKTEIQALHKKADALSKRTVNIIEKCLAEVKRRIEKDKELEGLSLGQITEIGSKQVYQLESILKYKDRLGSAGDDAPKVLVQVIGVDQSLIETAPPRVKSGE